jgi:glycosyltransferase involved in cell wall biosynthesis
MAAGLPVIATETTGYRDFVIHEETGLVVPVGDPRALSQAISRLTADAGLRRRLGAQARERAATFDEDVVLERFAQLIDRLASRG